jgi:superfamily II DNA or RNA helicase
MVIGPTIQQLTDMGFLSTAMVYAPPSDVDMTGAHVSMGDYQRDEVIAAVDKPKVTGCAVEHYRKFLDGKPAIAFCASVDHSKHVAEQFRQAGYMAQHVDGEMRETDRDLAVKSLGNGSIHVLTACDIISEGVDVPVVMGAILLRPTQSTGLFLQQVGRCLRPLPGKTAVILDHVGNCMRHGLPHDDREWSLDAPRQKRREPGKDDIAIRQCPKCYHVHRTAPQCPQCGFTYPVRKRELAVVKGELRLLTSDQMKQRRRFIAQRIQQGRTKDLDSLIELARARGYNEQWAYHVYQSRMRGKRGE